jgi:hypothetical protein
MDAGNKWRGTPTSFLSAEQSQLAVDLSRLDYFQNFNDFANCWKLRLNAVIGIAEHGCS